MCLGLGLMDAWCLILPSAEILDMKESAMYEPGTYIAVGAYLFQCQSCRVKSTDRTPAACVHHRPSLVVAEVIFSCFCCLHGSGCFILSFCLCIFSDNFHNKTLPIYKWHRSANCLFKRHDIRV